MTDKEFIENIDKIGADELFDTLEYIGCDGYYYDLWYAITEELKKRVVEERPTGEWKYVGMGIYECTNCKAEYEAGLADHCNINNSEFKYCPNCGADMRDTPKEKTCENCSFREHQEVCITCSRNYSDQYYNGEVAFPEENDNRH